MVQLDQVIRHIRDREYMSGVERDKARVKATGEIFTKEHTTRASLDKIKKFDQTAFSDPFKTFCDPACGDGNLISEVLIQKMESLWQHREWIIQSEQSVGNSISVEQKEKWFAEDFEQALQTIYGVDLMPDNVKLCQDRLLCGQEHLRHIVEKNIVCADALRYHYRFDGTHPYDNEVKEQEKTEHFNGLFEFE